MPSLPDEVEKKLYRATLPASGTFSAYVRANSPEEAAAKLNEALAGQEVGLCYKCSDLVDSPVLGETDIDSVEEVDEEIWLSDAEVFWNDWEGGLDK